MTNLRELARQAALDVDDSENLPMDELRHRIADAVYTVVSTEYEKEIKRLNSRIRGLKLGEELCAQYCDQARQEFDLREPSVNAIVERLRVEIQRAELASAKTASVKAQDAPPEDRQPLSVEQEDSDAVVMARIALLDYHRSRGLLYSGMDERNRELHNLLDDFALAVRAESAPVALAKDAVDQFVVFQLRNTIKDRHVPGVVEALEREWRQKRDALILAVQSDHQEQARAEIERLSYEVVRQRERAEAAEAELATLRAPLDEQEKTFTRSDQPQPGSCGADQRGDDRGGSRP